MIAQNMNELHDFLIAGGTVIRYHKAEFQGISEETAHDSGKNILPHIFCADAVPGPAKSFDLWRQHDGHGDAGPVQPGRHGRRQPVQPGAVFAADAGGGRRRGCCGAGRAVLGKGRSCAHSPHHRCGAALWRHAGSGAVYGGAVGARSGCCRCYPTSRRSSRRACGIFRSSALPM